MTSALVYKEFRESGPIAAIGLLALMAVAAASMGYSALPPGLFGNYRQGTIPFVSDEFGSRFTVVAALLSLALAFRQSLGDFWADTQLFLFHRPISRARIYLTKVLTGLAIYLVCAALPVLIYAVWAAAPGTHASPFEWSMTAGAWKSWLVMTTLYLGALLTALRPAAWLGTRLAPLCAAAALAMFISFCWLVIAVPLVIAVNLVLIFLILDIADTRDLV